MKRAQNARLGMTTDAAGPREQDLRERLHRQLDAAKIPRCDNLELRVEEALARLDALRPDPPKVEASGA
jgi:hypothetical protein